MKLNSNNEWDPLKVVVVGSVDGFAPGLEIADSHPDHMEEMLELARQAYPQWYLDEVAEDLENLCGIFRQAGVHVLRPKWSEPSSRFETPNWSAAGFDLYNIRDLHIVFEDTLIVGAPSSRFRLFETYALQDLFYENFFEDGFKWISAPLPKLKGKYIHEVERSPSELETIEDNIHKHLSHGLSETFHYLDEDEVIFDTANIIRLGRDVLFLISSTGNRKAVKWLEKVLGPHFRVHATNAYRSSHLDSTILPLRGGTVLLNGARVNEKNCPKVLESWEKFYFTEPEPVPETEIEFHKSIRMPVYEKLLEKGVTSTLNHISSPWGAMNVMSIDPKTVLVQDQQKEMIKMLETKKFTVVPVCMRHIYTMLGGLHCSTLDVVRDSTL